MPEGLNDISNVNWLQKLAADFLKQRRRERRNRFIFRSAIVLIILLALVFGDESHKAFNRDRPHVGMIELKGNIYEKDEGGAKKFIKSLHRAYRSAGLKTLILKINSPGGSPVQADYMYREVMRLRKKFPKIKVYAVCTDMCASAAYYVASSANEIYANPSSLVGSIGVLFNGFGFVDAMSKLGISRRLLTAGKNKAFLDPFSPVRPEDQAKLKTMLKIIHKQFEDSVIKGRAGRLKVSDETFSGLFWTGVQAKSMGLIDEFGSVSDVVRVKKPGLRVINYTQKGNVFERVAKQFASKLASELFTRVSMSMM